MTISGLIVRAYRESDATGVARLLESAFPTPGEARLVETIRGDGSACVELVASIGERIVGHALMSTGVVRRIDGRTEDVWCFGPFAVEEAHRRRGIGAVVCHAACATAEMLHLRPTFVLGSDAYYPQFGFVPAVPLGYSTKWLAGHIPDSAFMVRCTVAGWHHGGVVEYCRAFDEIESAD